MKKIIFNVCGSINKGTGHTKRQITFYLYLINNSIVNKENCIFIVKNSELISINLLNKQLIRHYVYKDKDDLFRYLNTLKYNIIINDILDTEYEFVKKLKTTQSVLHFLKTISKCTMNISDPLLKI